MYKTEFSECLSASSLRSEVVESPPGTARCSAAGCRAPTAAPPLELVTGSEGSRWVIAAPPVHALHRRLHGALPVLLRLLPVVVHDVVLASRVPVGHRRHPVVGVHVRRQVCPLIPTALQLLSEKQRFIDLSVYIYLSIRIYIRKTYLFLSAPIYVYLSI